MSGLTKMMIVLQLVFALVCSVLLVLMVSRQENYKGLTDAANAKYAAAVASLADAKAKYADADTQRSNAIKQASDLGTSLTSLETRLSQLQASSDSDKLELKSKLTAAEARNSQLAAAQEASSQVIKAQSAELDKLRPMIVDQNNKLSELYQKKSEADNLLRAAENTIKRLQEQLAQNTGGSGSVAPLGSDGQITTYASGNVSSTPVNGKITSVEISAGSTLVEIPLGSRDGLQVNSRLYVYRSTGYVGEATVRTVTPDLSIAVIKSTKPGETVQKGDLVATVK